MSRTVDRLIFVYHASSGSVAAFVDTVKKLVMVKGCTLCAITHGVAGEKAEWKTCRESLGVPVDYLHLDEVPEAIKPLVAGWTPCILGATGDEYVRLLGPDELARCRGSVADLKGRLLYHRIGQQVEMPFNLAR